MKVDVVTYCLGAVSADWQRADKFLRLTSDDLRSVETMRVGRGCSATRLLDLLAPHEELERAAFARSKFLPIARRNLPGSNAHVLAASTCA